MHRVTWGPYRTVREAMAEDIDLSEINPMFSDDRSTRYRPVSRAGIATRVQQAVDRVPVRAAPRLGEHTDEILLELLGRIRGWCTTRRTSSPA
jgi:2-methylfumaryl-CoA isomerase